MARQVRSEVVCVAAPQAAALGGDTRAGGGEGSRPRGRAGLWVAVLGPDGAGKSTLIQRLGPALAGLFPEQAAFHFLPGCFRAARAGAPVRNPHGRPPHGPLLSLAKLGRYALLAWAGYLLRVRPLLARSALVLSDRWLDDLLVDPRRYRYGGPESPVRWLLRLLPRPHLLLVLDVPPETARARKAEVPPAEAARQVVAYRRLVGSRGDAVLLPAEGPPGEVLAQARTVIRAYVQQKQATAGKDLAWLRRACGLETTSAPPTHVAVRLPDGRAYFLSRLRPDLRLYRPQAARAWVFAWALQAALRLRVPAPGLRRVALRPTGEGKELFAAIARVLGRTDFSFSVALGTPGPHRKPVFEIQSPEGQVLAYAKVGWNAATRALVANEARALARLAALDLPFEVPQRLAAPACGSFRLCLQTAPRGHLRPAPRALTPDYVTALTALARATQVRQGLKESPFWARLTAQGAEEAGRPVRDLLAQALALVARSWDGRTMPFHFAHGDLAPWNALKGGGGLYLFDWEYGGLRPAGYDLVRFLGSTAHLLEGATPAQAAARLCAWAQAPALQAYLEVLDLSPAELRTLMLLSLATWAAGTPLHSKEKAWLCALLHVWLERHAARNAATAEKKPCHAV